MRLLYLALASTLVTGGVAHAQNSSAANAPAPIGARAHMVSGAVSETDWQQAELLKSFV